MCVGEPVRHFNLIYPLIQSWETTGTSFPCAMFEKRIVIVSLNEDKLGGGGLPPGNLFKCRIPRLKSGCEMTAALM